jgi:hypothetical protein
MLSKIWITIVSVSAILLFSFIFYCGVISYYQDISAERKILMENQKNLEKMMARKKELPSRSRIDSYNKWREELDSEIFSCKEYYKNINGTLLQWFPGLMIGNNGLPSENDFKVRYKAEEKAIIKLLKDKKLYDVSNDKDKNRQSIEWEMNFGFSEPSLGNLRDLQKHFWIQQKLFSDMSESNVARCERLSFPVSSTPYVNFPYGNIIPFNLTIIIQHKDIPIFISNVLKVQNKNKFFAILIKNISILRLAGEINNLPEIKELRENIPETEKSSYKPSLIKLPLSKLLIDGDVLCFDF